MLVRRLAFALLFVAVGAFGQAASTTTTLPDPPAAKTEAEKKAAEEKASEEKVAEALKKALDENKQATGADGSKAPVVKIEFVRIPTPKKESPKELAARVENENKQRTEARLGDTIILVADKDKLKDCIDWAHAHSKEVTLYINGNDTGTPYESFNANDGTLQFHLERTSDNKKLWTPLLRRPFQNWTRPKVAATIGVDHGAAQLSNAQFTLVVVKIEWYGYLWIIVLIAFLVGIFILAKEYELLRDGPTIDKVQRPYSLGRCQMAWWFVLIIVSFVLIWLISGDQETITASLLGLMGISAGTALGAALIEASSDGDRIALQAALAKAQQDLETAKTALIANPADAVAQKAVADAQTAVDNATQKLNDANLSPGTPPKVPKTSWWLREILSDSDGKIALHRFQIVVWTFVLGVMFVTSVVTELTMPEFSPTLLATMGISAGTYLGFKFPEK